MNNPSLLTPKTIQCPKVINLLTHFATLKMSWVEVYSDTFMNSVNLWSVVAYTVG